ncbi:MAG TPA: alpha/beta fold hydrolase [Actinomycetota bacterium]|nr:alpha/beta fold hydrolase [Actinomycetota bacterium]
MTARRARRIGAVAVVCVIVALPIGCSGDAADEAQVAAALEASAPTTFETRNGRSLAGRLFGPDDAGAGVVLAHGYAADQREWFPFADRLGDAGYRVLTFNFRGYCPDGDGGCSEGRRSVEDTPADLRSAIEALRDDGVSRVAVVGSSMGGTAALLVAADADLAAVVALSAPAQFEGLALGPDVLAAVEEPKLFIAGTEDAAAASTAQTFFDSSLQPKRLEILTTGDHGAEILRGNQGEIARNAILGWLDAYLADDAGP